MGETATIFIATLAFACVAFAGMCLALIFPKFFGRKTKRRCACAASREAMRLYGERERAALDAKRYRPETVDVRDLPQVSSDLVDLARVTNRSSEKSDAESSERL
ncbi:MAG: hypothetical protein IKU86_08215 [Thermoguttaceae bacterium]|nr:hypothetical protein [Thermoguttaceae bacterium]